MANKLFGSSGEYTQVYSMPVSGGQHLYQGDIVAVKTSGDGVGTVVGATDAANRRVIGVALEEVDATDYESGELFIQVGEGNFKMILAAAHTQAHVGAPMYVNAIQTVTSGSGSNSVLVGRLDKLVPYNATSSLTASISFGKKAL